MPLSNSVGTLGSEAKREFKRIVSLHQAGQLAEAEAAYRVFLKREPEYAPGLHMLGVIHLQRNDFQEAKEWIGKAIVLDSEQAVYFNNYGAALHRLEQRVEALAFFHRAVEIRPGYVDALSNLGLVYDELGQWAKAAAIFHQALELAPDNQEVKLRYGTVAQRRGEGTEVIRLCEELLQHQPTAELHVRIGNHLIAAGKTADAQTHYEQALESEPANVPALFNLGNAYQELHRIEDAKVMFRRAADAKPRQAFWRLRELATCPVIWRASEEIDGYCETLSAELDRWTADPPRCAPQDLVAAGAFPNFSFAYLGRNVVELKRKFAELYGHYFCHVERGEGSGTKERIRLGIVVTPRHEGIFIRCMAGILNRMNRERFEIILFCGPASLSKLQPALTAASIEYVTISLFLEEAAQQIRRRRCDVVHYWEAGSDSLNYFLPFCRLAPIQTTSHGSQITSGNPAIDYFYSSSLMELENASQHYAEKLWNSQTLLMHQGRLPPPPTRTRAHFGLPENRTLYMSLQNPLKLHPDFMRLLTQILREDQAGAVVLLRGTEFAEALLKSRFAELAPELAERIFILPMQPFPDYLALIQLGDVLLDPLYFGWGSSAYDCFSFNQPLVTMPTQLNVGRVAHAFYDKMGIRDLVADSREHYVQLALELGRNLDYRASLRSKIASESHVLFNDMTAVADHERFFEQVCR